MAPAVSLSSALRRLVTGGAASLSSLSMSQLQKRILPPVAVFWDLDNNPPKEIHPYDAAIRLKLAAARFGPIKFAAAYGDHDACILRKHSPDPEYHLCFICGRRFYNHGKLVNHFKQIHEREQAKRVAKIDSARGGRRVRLVGDLSSKMQKFRRAAAEMLAPRVGGRGDGGEELRRAGICLRRVDISADVVAVVEQKAVGCLVVVSDDGNLAGVLKQASTRGLKTVVVGDEGGEGALKRIADVGFSWREVASGKARKEAAMVIDRWKDRDLLRKLEWTYRPGEDDDDSLDD